MGVLVLGIVFLIAGSVRAAETPAAGASEAKQPHVRYRKAKDVNFEELLIQGQMKRGEISVVTGDAQDGTDGLLRLRENFLDRVAVDAGEDVQ